MITEKKIYRFGAHAAEGDGSMKDLLGGKGAGLAHMSKMGLPVPAGFTIPTTYCVEYMAASPAKKEALLNSLTGVAIAEFQSLKSLMKRPILVSVRSGARVSMPGMMDTILNVGLTSNTADEIEKLLGSKCALDCAKRLGEMWAKTVGQPLPDTLEGQLRGAIKAVFESWNSERAVEYRKIHNIPNDSGTAVTIQVMVYGNLSEQSCSGVLFTRDPSTGSPQVVGEFLPNAQGEDVVAGTHTPLNLAESMPAWNSEVCTELLSMAFQLEESYRDMQDIEFTVEHGKLYLLQTRSAKRSAAASFKVATDLVAEGTITKAEAIKRVSGKQYLSLSRPVLDPKFSTPATATGLAASPGLVSGVAVLSSKDAKASKVPCILVAEETTPDDLPGMNASVGMLTYKGGMTSHAAVVARGMDKACVVGLHDLDVKIKAGDVVTLDGSSGRVWVNVPVPIVAGAIPTEARTLLNWALEASGAMLRYSIAETGKPAPAAWASRLIDVLPATGNVVLDLSGVPMRSGYQYLSKGVIMALNGSKKGLSGVLSFAPPGRPTAPEDVEFLGLLGADKASGASWSEVEVKRWMDSFSSTMGGGYAAVKKRWSIQLPTGLPPESELEIKAAGWRTVPRVSTVDDLLEIDGYFVLTPEGEGSITQKTRTSLLALLKKAGKTVEPMADGVDPEYLAYSVLGK